MEPPDNDTWIRAGDLAFCSATNELVRVLWTPEFPRAGEWVVDGAVTVMDAFGVEHLTPVAVCVLEDDLPTDLDESRTGRFRRLFWELDDLDAYPIPLPLLVGERVELEDAVQRLDVPEALNGGTDVDLDDDRRREDERDTGFGVADATFENPTESLTEVDNDVSDIGDDLDNLI
jgi:hypothetical protein